MTIERRIFALIAIAGLFTLMGCLGQDAALVNQTNKSLNTTPSNQGQNTTQLRLNDTGDQNISSGPQIAQNDTPSGTFKCVTGADWSGEGGMQGKITGIETFKGVRSCHAVYSFSPTIKFDYYIDMNKVGSVCYVMSSGSETPTEICGQ